MDDFKQFCEKILNIEDRDKLEIIENIIEEEKKNLLLFSDNTEGFCKYIASQILYRLKRVSGIRTYSIDLNELISFNHVVLIAEYRHNDEIKRVLIDPTFEQFKPVENRVLYKLQEWPYEKLKEYSFLKDLITKGAFLVNEETFNQYLNAFTSEPINISLQDYLQSLNFKSDIIKR